MSIGNLIGASHRKSLNTYTSSVIFRVNFANLSTGDQDISVVQTATNVYQVEIRKNVKSVQSLRAQPITLGDPSTTPALLNKVLTTVPVISSNTYLDGSGVGQSIRFSFALKKSASGTLSTPEIVDFDMVVVVNAGGY